MPPLGVGCAYDLPLPNFQFETKFNRCQAMHYKQRRYNLCRTHKSKQQIRPNPARQRPKRPAQQGHEGTEPVKAATRSRLRSEEGDAPKSQSYYIKNKYLMKVLKKAHQLFNQ